MGSRLHDLESGRDTPDTLAQEPSFRVWGLGPKGSALGFGPLGPKGPASGFGVGFGVQGPRAQL